jgi:hypothetical protein
MHGCGVLALQACNTNYYLYVLLVRQYQYWVLGASLLIFTWLNPRVLIIYFIIKLVTIIFMTEKETFKSRLIYIWTAVAHTCVCLNYVHIY